MTERCVFSLAIRTQRANRHPYRIDHLLFVHGLLVVHQNETLACRSPARPLRQGRLRGYLRSIANYSRRRLESQVRIFMNPEGGFRGMLVR